MLASTNWHETQSDSIGWGYDVIPAKYLGSNLLPYIKLALRINL
jgi:hypothetical protein